MALRTDSSALLSVAKSTKAGSPDLRLKLEEISTPAELVRRLRRPHGILQIGPEGEHSFNGHVGPFILNLTELAGPEAIGGADYILQFCSHMGFRLFACHYQEELEHEGRMLRKSTTLIIAAAVSDPRIRKTDKGFILDYVMDRRKQLLHRVLKGWLTVYDWMEDQMISRSNGEERVRAELLRIHEEIRKGRTPARPTRD